MTQGTAPEQTQDTAAGTPAPHVTHAGEVDRARLAADGPYQRQRLWAGVLGIGAVLIAAWAAVALGLGDGLVWLTQNWPAGLAGLLAGVVMGLLASVVQLPFDYFGGRVVEGNFRQLEMASNYQWGRSYGLQLAGWIATLGVSGAVVAMLAGWMPGVWPVVVPLVLVGLGALRLCLPLCPARRGAPGLARRPWTEQVVAELKRRKLPVPVLQYFDHGERSLAGGWGGFGGLKRLWVSTTLWEVRPVLAAALIARELTHEARGHRVLSLMATGAWVLLGCVLGWYLMPGRYASDGAGAALVVFLAAWLSTWSWISLLFVFPAMGRWQVLAADRGMLESGFSLEESLAALRQLAECNKPDEDLPGWIAFVFHPIPPMRVRRAALVRAAGEIKGAV